MEPERRSNSLTNEFEKVQLLLAEKRTTLSLLRTGIALFALPLSVASILIATSHYYDSSKVLYLFIPLVSISIILLCLGSWIVGHSFRKYRALDIKIGEVKIAHEELKSLITWA
jgi:uncharacterized membrane protein YidH (DUF202 family)